MYSLFFAGRQNPGREFTLQHRFTAGKGYAPAGFLVVGTVAQDTFQKFLRRDLPALQNQGCRKTLGGTAAAAGTTIPVDIVPGAFHQVRLFGADLKTTATADTARGVKLYLRLYTKRLGVMAPNTTAATAFEKHRCPYSRAIVYRETLNIKNYAFTMHAA
jgi:hypothetical protein